MQLSEFQNLMRELYFEKDRERGLERTLLWFIEEVGELVKAIRKGSMEDVREEVGDVQAWLMSIANLLDVDVEEAVGKYQQACPKCGANPCECGEPHW